MRHLHAALRRCGRHSIGCYCCRSGMRSPPEGQMKSWWKEGKRSQAGGHSLQKGHGAEVSRCLTTDDADRQASKQGQPDLNTRRPGTCFCARSRSSWVWSGQSCGRAGESLPEGKQRERCALPPATWEAGELAVLVCGAAARESPRNSPHKDRATTADTCSIMVRSACGVRTWGWGWGTSGTSAVDARRFCPVGSLT